MVQPTRCVTCSLAGSIDFIENRAKVSDCIHMNYVLLSCDRTRQDIRPTTIKLSTCLASYWSSQLHLHLQHGVGVTDAHMGIAHMPPIAPAVEPVVVTSHLFVACLVNAQSKIYPSIYLSISLCICGCLSMPHSWPAGAAAAATPSWPRPILVMKHLGFWVLIDFL